MSEINIGPEALLAGRGNYAEAVSKAELEEKFKKLPATLRKVLVAVLRHRSGF